MFVRFERRKTGEGLFVWILDDLMYDDRPIRRRDRPEFRTLANWLYNNTPPTRSVDYATVPGGAQPRTWWRPRATEHIRVSWRICRILNRSGIQLRPIQALHAPGPVLYEDNIQAVILCGRAYIEKIARYPQPRPIRGAGWNGDRTTIRRWSHR